MSIVCVVGGPHASHHALQEAGVMSLTYSEVWGGERVGGASVLADDGGGVALLAGVLAAAARAGHLADGGGEDHLDPAGVVPR